MGNFSGKPSGVTIGWAGWAISGNPRVQGPPSSRQKNSNNFSFTMKIRTSGYRTLECFIATLPPDVHILGCELHKKCVWQPGSTQTRWGSYGAPRDRLAVIRGRGRKGLGIGRGRKGWEGKGVKGIKRDGKGKEGMGRGSDGKGVGRERKGEKAMGRERGGKDRLG